MTDTKAIVLLSGGLDSATALAIAKEEDFEPYALSINYGQMHSIELGYAMTQGMLAASHKLVTMDLSSIAGSSLVGTKACRNGLPTTYVPARNAILLSLALCYAETIGAYDIFIGANAIDYSGYPDCREDFLRAFEQMAKTYERPKAVRIHAPLLTMSKAGIICTGFHLNVDYSQTWSCYSPMGSKACGGCESCKIRLKGFADAGMKDPVAYAQA